MTKFYNILLGLSCLITTSCNGSQEKNIDNSNSVNQTEINSISDSTIIEVTVKGYDSGKVFLVGYYTGNPYIADSTEMSSTGSFSFKPKEPYKSGYYFFNLPDNKTIQLLIDKDQEFTIKTNSSNILSFMEISGSLDNKLMYNEFLFSDSINTLIKNAQKQQKAFSENDAEFGKYKDEIDSYVKVKKSYLSDLFNSYPNTFYTKFKNAGQNPELKDVKNPDGSLNTNLQYALYRRAFFNNVDFTDNRLLYTPVVSNKLEKYMKQLTAQHPDSVIKSASYLINKVSKYPDYFNYFANWITMQFEPGKSTLMDAEAVYVHMIQSYFTNELAFWSDSTTIFKLQTRAKEMESSLIGKKGLDVISKNPKGETKSIYEITTPYIIVFMYSPDCEHCQEEIPRLKSFYNEWKNKGVSIFAIALETYQEEWVSLIQKNNMSEWTNVFDPTNASIYAKYYVDVTPEIYVLNPDRIIIGKNLKSNQIEVVINRDRD